MLCLPIYYHPLSEGLCIAERLSNIGEKRPPHAPMKFSRNKKINTFSLSEPHRNGNPAKQKLSPEAKDILASDLHLEYDLYNFVLRRLDQQLKSIKMAGR